MATKKDSGDSNQKQKQPLTEKVDRDIKPKTYDDKGKDYIETNSTGPRNPSGDKKT